MSQSAPSGLGLRFLKGALLGLESSHHSAVDHPVWSLSPHTVSATSESRTFTEPDSTIAFHSAASAASKATRSSGE